MDTTGNMATNYKPAIFFFVTFLRKKVTKKPPEIPCPSGQAGITARFREGALIELWYYCNFNHRTFIHYANEVTSRLIVVNDKGTIAAFTVVIQMIEAHR